MKYIKIIILLLLSQQLIYSIQHGKRFAELAGKEGVNYCKTLSNQTNYPFAFIGNEKKINPKKSLFDLAHNLNHDFVNKNNTINTIIEIQKRLDMVEKQNMKELIKKYPQLKDKTLDEIVQFFNTEYGLDEAFKIDEYHDLKLIDEEKFKNLKKIDLLREKNGELPLFKYFVPILRISQKEYQKNSYYYDGILKEIEENDKNFRKNIEELMNIENQLASNNSESEKNLMKTRRESIIKYLQNLTTKPLNELFSSTLNSQRNNIYRIKSYEGKCIIKNPLRNFFDKLLWFDIDHKEKLLSPANFAEHLIRIINTKNGLNETLKNYGIIELEKINK